MNAPGDDGARFESAYESASRPAEAGGAVRSHADIPSAAAQATTAQETVTQATATLEAPAEPRVEAPTMSGAVPTVTTAVHVVSPRELGGASKRSPALIYAAAGTVGLLVTLAIVGPPWAGDAEPRQAAAPGMVSSDEAPDVDSGLPSLAVTDVGADARTDARTDADIPTSAAVATTPTRSPRASGNPGAFGVPVYSDVEVRASTQRYAYLPGHVRDPHAMTGDAATASSPDPIDPAAEARSREEYRTRVQRETYEDILARAGITSADARAEISHASEDASVESPASRNPSPLVADGLWPDRDTITSDDPDRARAALAASMRLADGGELDRALVQGLVAWRHAATDPRTASHMAELSLRKGDTHAAVLWARDAIETSPDFARAWVNLGAALLAEARAAEARDAYRYAVSTNPDDWRAVAGLARAQSLLGFHAEAIAGYRNAIALASDETVLHFNLGLALERGGRLAEARQAFLGYLRLSDGKDPGRESRAREWLNRTR